MPIRSFSKCDLPGAELFIEDAFRWQSRDLRDLINRWLDENQIDPNEAE
ncbi:MAG: hypothetical protein AAF589_04270 [Planctomycetota bacterium]